MAEKVTTMVLNVVDLQCSKCYKKIKKILCKFPEIRDQKYDEKANKVTITVVCCSPEKIRDKLCCKGCGCIKSIEIIEPKQDGKQKQDGKDKTPSTDGKDKTPSTDGKDKTPSTDGKDKTVKVSVDVQVQGFCYCNCCSGRPWGPCSCGGRGTCSCGGRGTCSCGGQGPCSCGGRGQCDLCCGRPVCDSWCAYGSGCEETQQGCSIM